MAQPFKFRHTNAIVGAFVLAALVAVVGGFVYAGKARRWFESTSRLTIVLPEDGASGLKEGADVMMSGTDVGSVVSLDPGNDGQVIAVLKVREKWFKDIKLDSVVKVKKTLGIAGDAFVEIGRGRGAALPLQNPTLAAAADEGYAKLAEDVLHEVRAEVIPTIQELRATLTETRLAVEKLRDPQGEVQLALASIRSVIAEIEQGRGLLGRLVKDQNMGADAAAVLPRINASLDQLHELMIDLKKTSEALPELVEVTNQQAKNLGPLVEQTQKTMASLDEVLGDLKSATGALPGATRDFEAAAAIAPGLLLQAQDTLRQIQKLAEALQRSWLIGGGTAGPTPSRLIPPEAVGGSK